MKKTISKTVKVLAAILAVILIAAIILLVVKPNQVAAFEGYKSVSISALGTTDRRLDLRTADTECSDQLSTLNKGLKDSRYNVMHGILEWKANTSLKFQIDETIDEDDRRVKVKESALGGITLAENEYRVSFVYDSLKSVTVEGETIEYNRALLFVSDTENEIGPMTVYFYNDDLVGRDEHYVIYPVSMRLIGTRLYKTLTDMWDAKA